MVRRVDGCSVPTFLISPARSPSRAERTNTQQIQGLWTFSSRVMVVIPAGLHGVSSATRSEGCYSPSGAGFNEIYLQQCSSYQWIGQVPVADGFLHLPAELILRVDCMGNPQRSSIRFPSRVRMVIPSRCQIDASPVARPGGGCFPAEYL